MAKGIGINGEFRGKVGGIVYSRVEGQQISRARATQIKNPKTNKQQAQRMIFATATQAYSTLQKICNHSFEGVKYGSKSQQYFMKNALDLLRNRAAQNQGNFIIPGANMYVKNPFMISKGSLSSPTNLQYDVETITIANMSNPEHVTVGSWCNALGINKGDQVTLVALTIQNESAGDFVWNGHEFWYPKLHLMRITVKPQTDDDTFLFLNGSFTPAAELEGYMVDDGFKTTSITNDKMVFKPFGSYDEIIASAVIRSSKNGSDWKRSTEYLNTNFGDENEYLFENILPAWIEGVIDLNVGTERYLNNAEQSATITSYDVYDCDVLCFDTTSGEVNLGTKLAVLRKINGNNLESFYIVDSLTAKHPYHFNENNTISLRTNKIIQGNPPMITLDEAQRYIDINVQG